VVSALLLASVAFAQPKPLPLENISLPQGFAIELVARVDNARQMALGAKGTLFVGSMRAGKVIAYEPFAAGWLQGEDAWGRPADVLVGFRADRRIEYGRTIRPRFLVTATWRRSAGAPPTGPCHACT
jgi:hypothetical protein